MRSEIYVIATGLLILGVGIGIGIERHWLSPTEESTFASAAGDTDLLHATRHLDPEYVCPMHSDIVEKAAGSCPICGMDLVAKAVKTEMNEAHDGLPVVAVSPAFIHNFGVRTAKVSRGPVARRIEAIGRVARMPQPKVVAVTPGVSGHVIAVSDRQAGDEIRKGELLYELEARQWQQLQQDYLAALSEADDEKTGQLRKRLLALGMNPARLGHLELSGKPEPTLKLLAPREGVISEWTARVGDSVQATTRVVTLGGMNRVPVTVSLFEGQGGWIQRGQPVSVRVPSLPRAVFKGQVDRTDREINFSTRTLPVYAGFYTSDPRIRYGMLVDVTIEASARNNVLRVPREALIRTGAGSRVIIALGDGRFQPVEVVPGLGSGEFIEILSGLDEGQDIVVSGQFLIDSESNLQAGFQRMQRGDDAP